MGGGVTEVTYGHLPSFVDAVRTPRYKGPVVTSVPGEAWGLSYTGEVQCVHLFLSRKIPGFLSNSVVVKPRVVFTGPGDKV